MLVIVYSIYEIVLFITQRNIIIKIVYLFVIILNTTANLSNKHVVTGRYNKRL